MTSAAECAAWATSYFFKYKHNTTITFNGETYLAMIIIAHYSQDYDVAFHTTYVVCINFMHEWRDLEFKVDSERQIFEKHFIAIFIFSFWYLTWGLNSGFTSNEPTKIIDFIVPALDGIDVNDVWFQQNGKTCHTSQATIDLLL